MDDPSDLWEWLNGAQGRGIQPGLERMVRLLEALGNPEKELRCLHVAGTNGKGSVCAFAESVLRAAGYHTGFYSSPHLVDFGERIRIAGVPASRVVIEEGLQRLKSACDGWREEELPTYFELVTALAFDLFARADCEVVVLETGLGGRLDATNTAPKVACAITPIALDHTEWLGTTLAAISREKAGIFRPKIPSVIATQPDEAMQEIERVAGELRVPLIRVVEAVDPGLTLGLSGSYQRFNAALAVELVRAGGFHPSREEIAKGLATVSWPGRFQRLKNEYWGGDLILDGAHNLHAVRQLVETWHEEFGDRKCRLIFGALADKDPGAMLLLLEPIAEEVFLVPVVSPRSLDPEGLRRTLRVPCRLCGSLSEALEQAFPITGEKGGNGREEKGVILNAPVLLTGSLFLVGEALSVQAGESFLPRSQ